MKPYSIARRLITTVLLVELLSALCVTGVAWFYERHSHFRSFDIMLRGRADSLLGAVQDAEDNDDNVMLYKNDLDLPSEDVYEVRDEKGRLLGRSPNWDGPGPQLYTPHDNTLLTLSVKDRHYRTLLLHGQRVVDPGDKGGGVARHITVVYGSPTRRVWKAVMETVKFYAAASLVLLAVTGIVMAWLLNRGMTPLRELAGEAANVSVNSWEFNPSERARATQELAPLVAALETALQGLERSFLQQRRFISDAAHELKTGVAVVKSSLQLLGMKQRTAAEYEAGLERCEADCARMEEIVAKMLTLARAESMDAGQRQSSAVSDIAELMRQVAYQFRSMAELRRVAVAVSASESHYVRLAPEECSLLLSNLLQNALQHSAPGTQISALVEQRDGMAELRIRDQGDGIDPEALPHVFERFYRGDPSRNRNTGGTGLGLSISKAIVDAARGKIDISSKPGIGTTVIVRLPIADSAAPARSLEPSKTEALPSA